MKTKKVKNVGAFAENAIEKGTQKLVGGNAQTTDDFVTEDHVMLKQSESSIIVIDDHLL